MASTLLSWGASAKQIKHRLASVTLCPPSSRSYTPVHLKPLSVYLLIQLGRRPLRLVVKTLIATCTCLRQRCLLQSLLLHSELQGNIWWAGKLEVRDDSLFLSLSLSLTGLFESAFVQKMEWVDHRVIHTAFTSKLKQQDEVSHLVQINKFVQTSALPGSGLRCSAAEVL